MSRSPRHPLIALAAVLAIGACSESVLGPDDAASDVAVLSGNNQSTRSAAVAAAPLVVRVTDRSGNPVFGASVRFVPAAGAGSVASGIVATDSSGRAQTTWTLAATPGTYTLSAFVTDVDTVQFTATVVADRLELVSGNTQSGLASGELANPIVVRLIDLLGRPVPGVAVTFAPGAAAGTVAPSVVATDATGEARTVWTLGAALGAKTLQATAPTASAAVSVSATALQDTSRVLTIAGGDLQVASVNAALAAPLSVRVQDRFGNPVVGQTIEWTELLTNGVTVTPTQSVTDATGVATTTARLGVAVDSVLVRAKLAGRAETVTFLATGRAAYTDVAVGNFASCALAAAGTAYCWGANGNGQLGKASSIPLLDRPSTPVTLGDSLAGAFPVFRSLALGRTTACGVTLVRRLVCWGVGSGTFGNTRPAEIGFSPTVTVQSASVGEGHTCLIDIDGLGWCGGENRFGQLGNGSTTSTSGTTAVPVLRRVGLALERPRLAAVALGRSFGCAFRRFDPADATTRQPVCWGDNAVGQLGRGTTAPDSVSATVSIPVGAPVAFDSTSLVVGLEHACVLADTGAAFCWGSNGFGQLGNGGVTGAGARAVEMVAVTMPGGQAFVRLAAGEYHTCGLAASGAAFCWGRNAAGQLGDGTQIDRIIPTAVVMPAGGVTFKTLSLGELHSCAVAGTPATGGSGTTATTGRAFCWGDNEYGQLGDGAASGNRASVLQPKLVVNQP